MIADEVITGFGRTGRWFGVEHDGVVPDLMSVAKGITSGYVPLSASIARRQLADAFPDDSTQENVHPNTYAAHPVACAAALANLQIMEKDNLVENAAAMGDAPLRRAPRRVGKMRIVGEVRGRGLMVCAELVAPDGSGRPLDKAPVARLDRKAWDRGAIVYARDRCSGWRRRSASPARRSISSSTSWRRASRSWRESWADSNTGSNPVGATTDVDSSSQLAEPPIRARRREGVAAAGPSSNGSHTSRPSSSSRTICRACATWRPSSPRRSAARARHVPHEWSRCRARAPSRSLASSAVSPSRRASSARSRPRIASPASPSPSTSASSSRRSRVGDHRQLGRDGRAPGGRRRLTRRGARPPLPRRPRRARRRPARASTSSTAGRARPAGSGSRCGRPGRRACGSAGSRRTACRPPCERVMATSEPPHESTLGDAGEQIRGFHVGARGSADEPAVHPPQERRARGGEAGLHALPEVGVHDRQRRRRRSSHSTPGACAAPSCLGA